MQYLANGMDIPDELIRQHEVGRVVFFCGAGISYESHLPDFKTLTDKVFEGIGEIKSKGEEKQYLHERYDAVLGSLENRLAKQPSLVRRKVRDVLTPDKTRTDNSVETHKALVALATSRGANPTLKLVTTNFDLLFEPLLPTSGPCSRRYVAPFLPTPRMGLWNGMVYLHGKLPNAEDDADTELANLVLTSGDFGRAYLTEAWAARFVAELLRNYVVCFIGYSLGDQTVRYLMDAVEVYKRSGNKTEDVYMFVSDSSKDDVICENKSLIQVTYNENSLGGEHAMLHKTLQAWAKSYSQGLDGKYEVIRQYASVDPDVIPDDGYVKKMVWALSGENDKTVKFFSDLPDAPNWGWVAKLEENHVFDDNLLQPNGSYNHSEFFSKWILNYMTEPDCILWAIRNRRRISRSFLRNVEEACNENKCEHNGKCVPLDPFAERVWRAVLAEEIYDGKDIYFERIQRILEWFKSGNIDVLKSNLLRELFTPKLTVEKSLSGNRREEHEALALQGKLIIGLTLPWHDASYFAPELRNALSGQLGETVETLTKAFEHGLDLLSYIYGTYAAEDDLPLYIRSIEDSDQNKADYHNIVTCVDMIREGWLELLGKDYAAAKRIARQWLSSKYPTMRRFGLYAASVSDVISNAEWVAFFANNHGFMLWQPSVMHEMLRLFASKGSSLNAKELETLTMAIVKGPPACMRIADQGSETKWLDYKVFIRLEKLIASGATLPVEIDAELSRIKDKYPQLHISPDGSDEYILWSGTNGGESEITQLALPEEPEQLVEWLNGDRNRKEMLDQYSKTFREVCDHRPTIIVQALKTAIERGIWNRKRILQALNIVIKSDAIKDMAELVMSIAKNAPLEEWQLLANEIGHWCEEARKTNQLPDGFIAGLSQRFFEGDYRGVMVFGNNKDIDFYAKAINHPIGRFVSALVQECFPSTIERGIGIREPYQTLFTTICTLGEKQLFYGRIALASRANALYHADEKWTQRHLLVLATWGSPDESETVGFWQGFLSQNAIYPPILQILKNEFVATLNHWDSLGMFKQGYISILTGLALRNNSMFASGELSVIMHKMTVQQLEIAAKCVEGYMTDAISAGRDPNVFWRESVLPVLHDAWPKNAKLLTDDVVKALCAAFVTADEELAKGFEDIWFIKRVKKFEYDYLKIQNSKAITTCTMQVLELLDRLIENVENGVEGYYLEKCLDTLKANSPDIEQDKRFQRLQELSMSVK